MGRWWEQQSQGCSFQEGKSVSSWFPWGCSTWAPLFSAVCIETPVSSDICSHKRESIEKYMVSIVSWTVQEKSSSKPELEKHAEGWMSREFGTEGKSEMETGQNKKVVLLTEKIKYDFEGTAKIMKKGNQGFLKTKGRQTEWMWLPEPICSLQVSWGFCVNPAFTLAAPPTALPHPTDTRHTTYLWSFQACWIFLWSLPGVQATQAERGAWDGGEASDLRSSSHSRPHFQQSSNWWEITPQKSPYSIWRGSYAAALLIQANRGNQLHVHTFASLCKREIEALQYVRDWISGCGTLQSYPNPFRHV